MTKVTQRVLSLLLAAVLLFGMLPASAFATEAEQTGIAMPEADTWTDPPGVEETESAENTIPAEVIPVGTESVETTVPAAEPEATHSEKVTEPTQTVETVPETTHGEEVTEPVWINMLSSLISSIIFG